MKNILALLTIFILTMLGSAQAQSLNSSKSASTISEKIILSQLINDPALKGKEVQMLIVDFPPGKVSGPHRHPCETFGYLLQGELESVFEGKKHLYKKGDSFYEIPNGLHSVTKNPSLTETAKLLVFFITDTGKETSVHQKK
ncbi:MAG: cupin domain-containing protein [Chitinophagaceae bacterium]|nr:cupin domain-containing protein [Chitinophagaceae bacterium]